MLLDILTLVGHDDSSCTRFNSLSDLSRLSAPDHHQEGQFFYRILSVYADASRTPDNLNIILPQIQHVCRIYHYDFCLGISFQPTTSIMLTDGTDYYSQDLNTVGMTFGILSFGSECGNHVLALSAMVAATYIQRASLLDKHSRYSRSIRVDRILCSSLSP